MAKLLTLVGMVGMLVVAILTFLDEADRARSQGHRLGRAPSDVAQRGRR